jgi:hypothetical protein
MTAHSLGITVFENEKTPIGEYRFARSLQEFAELATQHCWSAGRFRGGHRKNANFEEEGVLALDVDGGMPVRDAIAVARRHGLAMAILPTQNHQKEKPLGSGKVRPACDRYRIILPLSRPITSVAEHAATHAWAIEHLFPTADAAARDAARFYYPSIEVHFLEAEGESIAVVEPESAPPRASGRSTSQSDEARAEDKKSTKSFASGRVSKLERARAYVAKVPGAVEGENGDAATYRLAAKVYADFDLSEEETMEVLAGWNEKCLPPWSPEDLAITIGNAAKYHTGERGSALKRLLPEGGKFSEQDLLETCVPILDADFRLFLDATGTERVFQVNERKEATIIVTDAPLGRAITAGLTVEYDGFVPTRTLVERTIDLWRRTTKKLSAEPSLVEFGPTEELTFRRFDQPPASGPHPAWDEFTSRLSDPDAFKAYVWCCFEPKNKSRQYVWLRGDGQDGKSTAVEVITEVFGNARGAINGAALKESRFLLSSLYGKAVVVYADCKDPKFGMSAMVRNITSGDVVPVEFKGMGAFTTRMHVKLFIHSNCNPITSTERADQSRMILIEVAETPTRDDPGWSQRLKNELSAFLYSCRKAYERLCPRGGDIVVSETTVALREDAALDNEADFERIFSLGFEVVAEARTSAKEVSNRLREMELTDPLKVGAFRQWMERTHGVKRGRSGARGRYYTNLALADWSLKGMTG